MQLMILLAVMPGWLGYVALIEAGLRVVEEVAALESRGHRVGLRKHSQHFKGVY